MKRILFAISFLLFFMVNNSMAQKSSWKYHFSGFVDPQLFYDTRQVVGGRETQMLLYPAPRDLDAEGQDLNAAPNLNMLAITTRMSLSIQAPDKVAGFQASGFVEGDFTGSTEAGINMLRLRHAYLLLDNSASSFLLGQYWHPLVVPEIMPGTRPLNMGMPFHPYSRYVQARYQYRTSQQPVRFQVEAVAAFQLDNASIGPNGKTTSYLRTASLPEGNLKMKLCWGEKNPQFIGVMANAEVLRPRTFVLDASAQRHQTRTSFPSFAFSFFGRHDFGQWSLRYQFLKGDNLYEQSLLGGYVESALDTLSNTYTYDPFGCATVWFDFRRMQGKWRPGLFCGYGANTDFGRITDEGSTVFGRGYDIDYLWRIQPQLGYFPLDWLNFFAEIEYTAVRYGEKNTSEGGFCYKSSYSVDNYRFILSAVFNF